MATNREQFGSKLGFILAAAGSAVGIGNLVGFPVNATQNGGGAFLLIYALFVFLVCLPVMLAELSAGRHTRKNPLGAYQQLANGSKLWPIGGWLALITPYMIAVFYAVVTLWVLGYLIEIVMGNLDTISSPKYFGQFINSNIVFAYLVVIAAIVWGVLHSGVQQGIERAAKVLMPSLFVLLIILVSFVLTRDNAMKGVAFYLIPDFSKITPEVINAALGQAFFSLSLGMGILITYGSYMNSQDSIPQSAKMVAITDTAVAFTAGLMILPAIFCFNPDVNPDDLSSSSVGLVFTYLPQIFLSMQGSIGYIGASIVAAIFFLLVLFAALTSLVSIIEVPVSGMMDQRNLCRPQALNRLGATMIVVTVFCAVSFGMVAFFTDFVSYGADSNGDGSPDSRSFFDLLEHIFYDTILPLNGFLICMLVSYRWRKAGFDQELELGSDSYKGSLLERYTNFALGSFIPAILLIVFINTVLLKFFAINMIDVLF